MTPANASSSAAFRGRRALVTGGANGIGAAVCERLAAGGAHVVLADVDDVAATALRAKTGATYLRVDLCDARRLRNAIEVAGPFDILVNSAGVDQHAWFTESAPAEWERLIGINLTAVLTTTHAVLPAMQAAGFGRIVNIASEAGRMGSRGAAVYAAAKGGVLAFTRSIARENARKGITANAVAPGPIDTPMVQRAVAQGGARLMEAMTGATLIGRLGRPDEVAAAVAFLASDDAGFITGETLGVSGGMGCGQ